MKAVVLVVPAEQAEEIAQLIAATLSMNGWAHNAPAVIDFPESEYACPGCGEDHDPVDHLTDEERSHGPDAEPPFSMPCGWRGWDLNQHRRVHERERDHDH